LKALLLTLAAFAAASTLRADEPLWDANTPLPKAAELPQVTGAKFYVLKKPRPDKDGSNFTLGVGLAWHKDKLYASYGFSTSKQENTADEEAHVRVSEDGGKTWGQPVAMDAGEGNLGVSHGVFLSHGGRLWAFMGAFYDNFYGPTSRTHTRGYVLNETSGKWEAQGVVLDQGFWPMQEPQQMADGNWIMSGVRIAFGLGVVGHLPAVAISQGDDFTKWEMVVIQADKSLGTNLWGESTVIVEKTQMWYDDVSFEPLDKKNSKKELSLQPHSRSRAHRCQRRAPAEAEKAQEHHPQRSQNDSGLAWELEHVASGIPVRQPGERPVAQGGSRHWRVIELNSFYAIFSQVPCAQLAARRLHRGLAGGPIGLSRSGSPCRMRTSTASGSANELRKLPTTRRKHEDETIPLAIQAFVDTCSDNRAHPGGSEHV
jgi:hypothetical protein